MAIGHNRVRVASVCRAGDATIVTDKLGSYRSAPRELGIARRHEAKSLGKAILSPQQREAVI